MVIKNSTSNTTHIHDGLFFPPTSYIQSLSEQELVSSLRRLYLAARDKKRERYPNWQRNYRLLNNTSSTPYTPNWAPIPRDSEIYPYISSMVAWMSDQNTMVDVYPAADPHSPYYDFMSHIANDLAAVVYSTWQTEGYSNQIKLCLWDTFCYGTGILKNVWDNSISDGYGNAVIRRVDPYAFYPDPNATSLDDCEYMVEQRQMSLNELYRRYPSSAPAVEAKNLGPEQSDRPSYTGISEGTSPANPGIINGVNISFSKPNSKNKAYAPIPMVTVYEYWIKDNVYTKDELGDDSTDTNTNTTNTNTNTNTDINTDIGTSTDTNTIEKSPTSAVSKSKPDSSPSEYTNLNHECSERWRLIVVADGQILMDEWVDEIWAHGQHPYERYVFDDIGEFYGISLVDHLAYPQIYINRLLTAMQQNAELTGNPVLLEAANSGTSRVGVVNRPGQRISLQGAAAGQSNLPRWLQPPQMPNQILDLIQFWISRIENITGLSAIVKGATPTQRNSEGVLSSVQEAAFVRIRAGLANLEYTLERCIRKIADLIIENYNEPRIVAIIGETGIQSSLALSARHFEIPTKKGASPLKYALTIKAGAASPTSRQARVNEADQLYAMGGLDRQSLLEAHQYPHVDVIMDRIRQGIADGTFGPPNARQRSGRSS